MTPLLTLQRINNNVNQNSANRSKSFDVRFRSGSLTNFPKHFNNVTNNNRFNQTSNEFEEPTQNADISNDTEPRTLCSSAHDLSFANRYNPNWQLNQQQFVHPFGYPLQYHVNLFSFYYFNISFIIYSLIMFAIQILRILSIYCFFIVQNHVDQNPCINCSQQQVWNSQMMDPQWNAKNLNGSNMSLNLPPNSYYPQPFDLSATNWMNNGSYRKPDGYPYPFNMMPMNNGK